jgi:hypothetical protein
MQDLEFQVGLFNGSAVGYCPQTGHVATIPLRRVAAQLQSRGQLGEVGADLLEALDYADDRPAVQGKIARKIKKGFKKVAKVAKKAVKSTLGKVLTTAVSMAAGPAGGAAIAALRGGIKLAKRAKAKKASAKKAKAKKAAPIAAKLAAKKITTRQATAKARAARVPPKTVKQAALALRVNTAAKAGNVRAQSLVRTAKMIDRAEASPKPLTVLPQSDTPGSSPFVVPAAPPAGGGGGGGAVNPFGGGGGDYPYAQAEAVELPEPYDDGGVPEEDYGEEAYEEDLPAADDMQPAEDLPYDDQADDYGDEDYESDDGGGEY